MLSDKEREVFAAVARGLANTEIAGSVFVSDSTVKTHVGAILRKLPLRDRIQTSCSPTNTGSPQGRPGEAMNPR